MVANYSKKTVEEKQKELEELSLILNEKVDSFIESPELIKDYIDFSRNFRNYSTRNRLLINNQLRGATFVASFKDWKEKGYAVLKGEKGLKIFVPRISKYFLNKQGQSVPLKYATIEEKRLIKENQLKVKNAVVGMNIGHVFDISQTNVPVEDYPKLLSRSVVSGQKYDFSEYIEAVTDYSQKNGIPIYQEPMPLTHGGYYSLNSDTIVLNVKLENDNKLSVLVHEVAHSQLHKHSELSTEEKEIQAQASADLFMNYYGFDSSSQNLSYIKDYSRDIDSDKRLGLIQNTTTFVIELSEAIETYFDEKYQSLNLTKESTKTVEGVEKEKTKSVVENSKKKINELELTL